MSESTGIPPNPGGALLPTQVLGRDSLVERYWRQIEQQSLALFSPRRVGKTSVMRRMELRKPDGWIVRFRDLEGLDSAPTFAARIYDDARELLSGTTKTLRRAKLLVERLSGSVELKNIKLTLADENWRRLLETLFEDLDEALGDRGERLVWLWDEFTLFIGDLTLRGMERDAMVLLDTLRAVRQRHHHIRMVLTGSVGFHLVMRQLDAKGYRNRPINDVRVERVPMLEPIEARPLVEALLRGIGKEPTLEVVEAIIAESEGHPFVIQHIVDGLRATRDPTAAEVSALLARLLAPQSVLDLGHYAGRLSKYYGEREALAFAILDLLALEPKGLELEEIGSRLSKDRNELLPTLQDLRDDDYLVQERRRFRFALELVRHHWREDRAL